MAASSSTTRTFIGLKLTPAPFPVRVTPVTTCGTVAQIIYLLIAPGKIFTAPADAKGAGSLVYDGEDPALPAGMDLRNVAKVQVFANGTLVLEGGF